MPLIVETKQFWVNAERLIWSQNISKFERRKTTHKAQSTLWRWQKYEKVKQIKKLHKPFLVSQYIPDLLHWFHLHHFPKYLICKKITSAISNSHNNEADDYVHHITVLLHSQFHVDREWISQQYFRNIKPFIIKVAVASWEFYWQMLPTQLKMVEISHI